MITLFTIIVVGVGVSVGGAVDVGVGAVVDAVVVVALIAVGWQVW